MKKKCDGCKALTGFGCGLGYQTKVTRNSLNGYPSDRKPLQECEKPKTIRDFLSLI